MAASDLGEEDAGNVGGGGSPNGHIEELEQLPAMELEQLLTEAVIVGVYRQVCSGIPLAVRFVGRDRMLSNSMVQGTQRFRQFRATSCVIPYVLCSCLYCLRC